MENYKFEVSDIVYYLDEELSNYYRVIDKKYYKDISIKGNWYLIQEVTDKQLLKQGWVKEDRLEFNPNVVNE